MNSSLVCGQLGISIRGRIFVDGNGLCSMQKTRFGAELAGIEEIELMEKCGVVISRPLE